jgi:signal transduction histidine kinase
MVRFTVRGAGPGVPHEYQQAVFDGLPHAGSPTGAAGIGLSIAKEPVRAHGGEIGLDSELAATAPSGSPFEADGQGGPDVLFVIDHHDL